jgi:hypothetical protein
MLDSNIQQSVGLLFFCAFHTCFVFWPSHVQHRRDDTPDNVMVEMAMQANGLTEAVVKTTIVDRLDAFNLVLRIANEQGEKGSRATLKQVFQNLMANGAACIFQNLVSVMFVCY